MRPTARTVGAGVEATGTVVLVGTAVVVSQTIVPPVHVAYGRTPR